MPSMSYCVIENMRLDLGTLFDVLNDLIENGDEINEYEQRNFAGLISGFREVVEMVDNAIADGIIDENGALCNSDDDDDGYDPDHAYENRRDNGIIDEIENIIQNRDE